MVSPHAADFIDQRFGRMRVLIDRDDGEVRRHERIHQREEGGEH